MFRPEDRLVFAYPEFKAYPEFPHGKPVYADPLDLRRKLVYTTKGKFDQFLDDQDPEKTPDKQEWERAASEEAIIKAAIFAFDFKPIDPQTGEGVTQAYMLDVLRLYLQHVEKKNQNIEESPTTPPSST